MFTATGAGSAGVAVALLVGVCVLPTIVLQLAGGKRELRSREDGA